MAVVLDQLKGFERPSARLEQWRTPGNIAAQLAFFAQPAGRTVVDLGCGTGILGIACKLAGAERVVCVEKDERALEIAKENARSLGLDIEFVNADVVNWKSESEFDIAVMNPPFGSVKRHIDREFVNKGLEVAKEVYAILSSRAREFWVSNYGAEVLASFKFPLRRQQWFHRRKEVTMEVDIVHFIRNFNLDS